MATRTTNVDFGVLGLGDRTVSFDERTLGVSFDFAKTNIGASKVVPILNLPKNFVIDRITVVQTEFANAAVTLTFGPKSDNAVTYGGNFALVATGTKLVKTIGPGASGATVATTDEDVLCMLSPESASITSGKIDVCVHGFEAHADGVASNPLPVTNYRKSLQTRENVGGEQFPLD